MKRLISVLYTIFLLLFILPSGTFFHLPIKAVLIVVLLLLYILYKQKIVFDDITIWLSFILVGLLIWSLISVMNGFISTMISFNIDFLSTVMVIWLSYEFYKDNIIDSKYSLKIISIVSVFIVLFYIFTSMILTLNFVSETEMTNIFILIFNSAPMTLKINFGGFSFYRVQFANSSIPILWMGYTLLFDRKLLYKLFSLLTVGLLAIITFSRVVLVEFAAVLVCAVLVRFFKNARYTKDEFIGISFIGIILVVVLAIGVYKFGGDVVEFIELRFNSNLTSGSDYFREIQTKYFTQYFYERPLFGYGAGSYLYEYNSSALKLYSYEREYLSFFYQFGIFGFIWIILGTITLVYYICFRNTDSGYVKFLILVNLGVWTLKPFFNPNFISSNSAIIVTIIFLYSHQNAYCVDEKKVNVGYKSSATLVETH